MSDFSPAVFGPPALRVGTAEREQAAEALGKHFAAGRLDVDEYDERVARAYAAKTTEDLSVLFTDLPRSAPLRAVPAAPRRSPRAFVPAAIIGVLIVAVGLAATTHIFPFFIVPLFFFLFLRSRRGFGPSYGHRHYR
ncbi:DUF1707 SHOCT-like domain-containing protein [Nocardia acidivorans]|uniref:DUF1707 SHOCT-like domain-containing protein n=1 Tax=Nocardia acidivorans TaxID=404580 RepID=UPI0008322C3B|nr:DUF1707 domain-containing protein [Nocardia acidivorans]